METEEPRTDPGTNPSADNEVAPAQKAAPPDPAGRVPLWLLTLAAGLVAGSVSWLGGEATQNRFPVKIQFPPEYARLGFYDKAAMRSQLEGQARPVAERKKTATAYGLLGALLGVALGLTGGWYRGSLRSGLRGAVVGGMTAAAAGAALSWLLVPVFFRVQQSAQAAQYANPDAPSGMFLIHFLIHAGIGAGIGAASGLALGLGLGDRGSVGRALIGGLFGTLAGVFVFETINSLAFPLLRTDWPMPGESIPRLVLHLGITIGTAVLAGLAAGERRRRSAPIASAR